MPRRKRIDSSTAAVEIMALAAEGPILPPAHAQIPEGAMPFWRDIIAGRSRAEWAETPTLLSTAANLAWTQYQIAQARGWIDAPETMPEGLKVAVLITRINDLQRLEMAYLRTLQQHARGAQGEQGRAVARRKTAKGIEAANPLDDPMLAPSQKTAH